VRIIKTHEVDPKDIKTQWERDQIYNGLDCCVTAEVLDELLPQLDNQTTHTYAFSRSLQGPALEMRLRGVLVDKARRAEVIDEFFEKLEQLEANLERMAFEGCGLPNFNWRSNADLQLLFYDKLGIPIIKKAGRPTVDRNALEKMEAYTVAQPLVWHMKAMRDLGKKISVLKTEIDHDGRMRTSYNIAGTSTGRFSSSFSEFGTGGNLQNVEESLRSIFIADPGMKLTKFDAKSGESFCVGAIEWNLFHDGRYLDVCETGDPHTAVARVMWPDLRWTGDLRQDRDIAEHPYYRHYTYRFMCKKLGHGSNYGGKPDTLSAQAKVPRQLVIEFQPKYFQTFPAHLQWQHWVGNEIRRHGSLVSLLGRKRHFWGRRNDDSTLREAIAYDPQSSLADIVNTAMLNIWHRNIAILYMHDHDALTFQYPEAHEDTIIPILQEHLKVPIQLEHNRVMTIPFDCVVGYNRGKWDAETNPDGLRDYEPGDQGRRRTPQVGILDRIVR
jgi:DNA polymerase-1